MVRLWFSSLIHCKNRTLMLLASNASAPEVPPRVWADDSAPDKDSLSTPTHTRWHRKAKCYINHRKCDSEASRSSFIPLYFIFSVACLQKECQMQIHVRLNAFLPICIDSSSSRKPKNVFGLWHKFDPCVSEWAPRILTHEAVATKPLLWHARNLFLMRLWIFLLMMFAHR